MIDIFISLIATNYDLRYNSCAGEEVWAHFGLFASFQAGLSGKPAQQWGKRVTKEWRQ
jgi:hypothetical protein